jgi:hypothetical protein
VTVSPGEYFRMQIDYQNLVPEMLRGLFDTRSESLIETEPVELFEGLQSGQINPEQMTLEMRINNQIGADLGVTINELVSRSTESSSEVALSHSIIQKPINLTRSEIDSTMNPPVKGFGYNVLFTEQNSNITEFLGLLPNEISYDIDLILNPLGSTSNGNDFLYYNTGLELNLDATLPLTFSAENILFTDTSSFEIPDAETQDELDFVQGGFLTVIVKNKYPIDIDSRFIILDSNKVILDSLTLEPALSAGGVPDENGRVTEYTESNFTVDITPDKLDLVNEGGYIVYIGQFNTVNWPDAISIYDDYDLKYTISGNLEYRVQTKRE